MYSLPGAAEQLGGLRHQRHDDRRRRRPAVARRLRQARRPQGEQILYCIKKYYILYYILNCKKQIF